MRRAHRYDQPIWDGVARYHDGMPIDVVKREFLDLEMAVFDNLPKRLRDQLNEQGGVAMEYRPATTGGY